jgi:hypothetical protein
MAGGFAMKLLRFLAPPAFLLLAFFLVPSNTKSPRLAAAPAAQPAPEREVSFRILLGLTDKASTPWDGLLSVSPGAVLRLEPWRFDDGDQLEGAAGWKIYTHQNRVFGGPPPLAPGGLAPGAEKKQQPGAGAGQQQPPGAQQGALRPVVANGVIATLRDLAPTSEVQVQTAHGNFKFRTADLPYGASRKFLDDGVMVDCVPVAAP